MGWAKPTENNVFAEPNAGHEVPAAEVAVKKLSDWTGAAELLINAILGIPALLNVSPVPRSCSWAIAIVPVVATPIPNPLPEDNTAVEGAAQFVFSEQPAKVPVQVFSTSAPLVPFLL